MIVFVDVLVCPFGVVASRLTRHLRSGCGPWRTCETNLNEERYGRARHLPQLHDAAPVEAKGGTTMDSIASQSPMDLTRRAKHWQNSIIEDHPARSNLPRAFYLRRLVI